MRIAILVAATLLSTAVFAQADRKAQQVKEDIAQHREIAAAHERAAKCLESGKSEKECHAPLAKECKGIALGKLCGMRHKH